LSRITGTAILVVALVAGCGAVTGPADSMPSVVASGAGTTVPSGSLPGPTSREEDVPVGTSTEETMEAIPQAKTGGGDEAVIAVAVADLAGRIGVAPDEIEVVSSESVTWRSGALGCSRPGMEYTQALVTGRRLLLSDGEIRYTYHQGGSGAPFLCRAPDEDATVPGAGS
jgi:hypothetical protein